MASYSQASTAKLATVCPELQDTFNTVIQHWDHTIFYGHRGQEEQNKAVADGKSTKPFPSSKHNQTPSDAVDAGPFYPEVPAGGIDWRTDAELMTAARRGDFEVVKTILENIKRWHGFIGFVRGVGAAKGYKIRSGGDWSGDHRFNDQKLIDLPHFEMIRP